MAEKEKPDFYELYLELTEEWEKQNGEIKCNEDYTESILYTMEKIWEKTKNKEI